MKKLMALLLAAVMLCGATSAMATALAEEVEVQEATPDFDVTVVVPEGYTMQESRADNAIYLALFPDDEKGAIYSLSIAHSEEYDGQTLNELPDDEKQALLDLLDEDFTEAQFLDLTTEAGTEVYLINENADETDSYYAAGFTIYKGYFIQIYAMKGDFERLSQDDLDLAMRILSDTWFVDKE